MQEPLSEPDAKRLIRTILAAGGQIVFTGHAYREMAKDGLSEVDCINVLRAGTVDPGEYKNGTWRYRVRGGWICVVALFRSESELVVVTAWRLRR